MSHSQDVQSKNKNEELWRTFENIGAACRMTLDIEGCARAYYEAAANDTYLRSQREHYSSYLFALHYLPGIAPEAMAEQHRVYGKLYPHGSFGEQGGAPHIPLRVGFLAPHFCESSAARFYEALLALPRTSFETFAYSLSDEADGFTTQVKATVAHYRVLPPTDLAQAEAAIIADDLDVLVDLGGHTDGGMTLMLLANHPAKRIIEAVGWFDTTGLLAVDELLTDTVMMPAGHEHLLTERPLRLPHAWCFTPSAEMRAARTFRPRTHAPVRLAAFQNFLKLNDNVLRAWKTILDRVPQAELHLRDTMRSPERVAALRGRCDALGFSRGRVRIDMGSNDYLAGFAGMDLVLDTQPYPGGAMTATALYLGVPVLTMRGDSHSRCVGASILTAAGLPELIAGSEEAYIKKAVNLASCSDKLTTLKEKVWNCLPKSALCDRKRYIGFWRKALQTPASLTEGGGPR